MTKLLNDIRSDVETGTSLSAAFRKHPLHFDALYCNLVEAGEAGGILEALLDRLAIYQEKTLAIKSKIKSALMYPIAVLVVAFVVLAVIMIFVIPAFKEVFTLLRRRPAGADAGRDRDVGVLRQLLVGDLRRPGRRRLLLPRVVEALREDADGDGPPAAAHAGVRRPGQQVGRSRAGRARCRPCSPPACRWSRRSTRWAAPRATRSIAEATEQIQKDVSTGSALTTVDADHRRVPDHGAADGAIGEESGSLDHMLGKAAEFYEDEVDETVKGLSSLMEPFIIVILGVLIGGIVVSMYLPIFKLGRWSDAGDGRRSRLSCCCRRWALALLGLCIGSFLNVVDPPPAADAGARWWPTWPSQLGTRGMARVGAARRTASGCARRPGLGERSDAAALSLSRPRSRCPSCGHALRLAREHPGARAGCGCAAAARPAGTRISRALPAGRSC